MNMKGVVMFAASFLALALGQVEDASSGEYLAQLKFSLREERLPVILNYLLNNSLEVHDIKTLDIIRLSKLDRYGLEEVREVFLSLNTSTEKVLSVDTLEYLLEALDLEFSDVYTSVTGRLDAANKMSQILQDLSIPVVNFTLALLGHEYIFDILRVGNYDEEHVNAALQTLDKSKEEVYAAFRDSIISFVTPLNSTHFMKILKENGWNTLVAAKFYEALKITPRDIYAVEKFRDIFTNITDDLNKDLSLAVFTAPNKVAVHETVYQRSILIIDGYTTKIQANGVEVKARKDGNVGEGIVELTTKQSTAKYIEITPSYNSSEDCSYVTLVNGQVSVESVEVVDSTINKTARTQFNLGSPLVCEGRLHGLAREETEQEISFDIFYNAENPAPSDDADNSGNSHYYNILPILTFNIFVYFALL